MGDSERGGVDKERMKELADGAAEEIKGCANVCDAYSKTKLIGSYWNTAVFFWG
jgi:hypothetical protein